LESFIYEENHVRFKDRHLGRVLSAIDQLKKDQQGQLVAEIAASVDAGIPKDWVNRDDFESALDSLKAYKWAAPLLENLKAKAALLSVEEN